MKTKILVVLFFISCGLFAAEKFKENPPPSYTVDIIGVNGPDYVEIKLIPARLMEPGEKIKVIIDDNCGNLVFAGTFYPSGPDFYGSSTIQIPKSEFDLSNPCFVDFNGDSIFKVYAVYDLNTGSESGNKQVKI